jgi:hypothetical protein
MKPFGFLNARGFSNGLYTSEKRAGFSTQLRLCCIQGTPGCAKILTYQVP